MLEIRYTPNADVDIRASKVELEKLRDAILELLGSVKRELRLEADDAIDPKPWKSVAMGMAICRQGDATRAWVNGDGVLRIQGSDENLTAFVSYFPIDETAQSGSHAHFEYYEGNPFITPDSLPLVIGVE
jgi:hypothetical protein